MVQFYIQDTDFSFRAKTITAKWLRNVAREENFKLGAISVIFCSDDYILSTNIQYLKHHYFTDIITFDYCSGKLLSGDLFISVDSVKDNSVVFKTTFKDELNRVIVHGLLHLVGYDDHTDEEKIVMRGKEDYYLSKLDSLR